MTSSNLTTDKPEQKCMTIWQFERKSVINWCKPFLSDDPPQFLSKDKQSLYSLSEYQSKESDWQLSNDSNWEIAISEESTDMNGWIYSDHFHSQTWTHDSYSSSNLCRKRKWIHSLQSCQSPIKESVSSLHSMQGLLIATVNGLYIHIIIH